MDESLLTSIAPGTPFHVGTELGTIEHAQAPAANARSPKDPPGAREQTTTSDIAPDAVDRFACWLGVLAPRDGAWFSYYLEVGPTDRVSKRSVRCLRLRGVAAPDACAQFR
jgi:hypothetical protein